MLNKIDLLFADGSYTFALPLPRIDELQRKTGVGIGGLFARVLKGCVPVGNDIVLAPGSAEFYAVDLTETIRQGLIGGNHGLVDGNEIEVSPVLANKLVDNYVLDRPMVEIWNIAAAILGAVVMGYDPPKKDEPAQERAPRKTTKKAASTTRKRSQTAQA